MILMTEDERIELKSLLETDLLCIKKGKHQRKWDYYQKQYQRVFYLFLEIAQQNQYRTNCKFMPFMFMMRHSLELFLKTKISNTETPWEKYGRTHNLSDLCQIADISDKDIFLDLFSCLKCNSEGDCWRYLSDKNGILHFCEGERIESFDACNYYCTLFDDNNSCAKDKSDKHLRWELTFHTRECSTLEIIGTQYDFAISDILLAIQSKLISINDVYLPLLFLLRHCLEIKLKAAILDLGDIVEEKDRRKAYDTHSVSSLYDILYKFIDDPIRTIEDSKLKEESIRFQKVTEQYKDAIQSLDANSYLFRFPKDRKGQESNFVPTKDCVSRIIHLYWESDSFLCFVVQILLQYGVLEIGDDKLREYYE